jgi:hypothetical protein
VKDKSEARIQDEIRAALGATDGLVLWRNNVGVAKHFDAKTHETQLVRYGLANGSADLVGVLDGRFIALEVKRPGEQVTAEQRAWLELVRRYGGFAAVVTSAADARAAIERARAGERC